MSATFSVTLPVKSLINSNDREHWGRTARKRAEMRKAAKFAAVDLEPLAGPVELIVHMAFPDRRHRDVDNYEVKGGIEGAVDAGVLPDDHSGILCGVKRVPADVTSPKGYAVLTFEFRPAREA